MADSLQYIPTKRVSRTVHGNNGTVTGRSDHSVIMSWAGLMESIGFGIVMEWFPILEFMKMDPARNSR